MIWIITFVCVLVLSVDYGIYIGLICSSLLNLFEFSRLNNYFLKNFHIPCSSCVDEQASIRQSSNTRFYQSI